MSLAGIVPTAIDGLREALRGTVIVEGDPAYDEARTVFLGGDERRPAAVVRPTDATEVALVVGVARETGLPLAVRSGGHSVARHSVWDGGIVVDLSALRGIEIDPLERTAWAQTGLRAGEYTTIASAHGLATGFGDTDSVGIGGITLGGGIGYLARKHGLTIDNLLAAEIVTADGRILGVDEENHPDLFWAVRGGGGNFGIATRFRFRLREVSTVLGGLLVLPATPEVLSSFVAEADAAPEELTTIADVMLAPSVPFLPEEHHGAPVIFVRLCYAGAIDEGERVLGPLRALAPPVADLVQPMPYRDIYESAEGYEQPLAVMRTRFVDSLDRDTAAAVIEHVRTSTPIASVELRVLGGAVGRVPTDATAFAHRDRRIMATVAAIYFDPQESASQEAWVVGLDADLPGAGAYVNFLGDEGPDRVREAYPGATWQRLLEVKDRYDPTNLFRLNQNVPPSRESDSRGPDLTP